MVFICHLLALQFRVLILPMSLQSAKLLSPAIKAKHQDDIITGFFSDTMMKDWDNDDLQLQDAIVGESAAS